MLNFEISVMFRSSAALQVSAGNQAFLYIVTDCSVQASETILNFHKTISGVPKLIYSSPKVQEYILHSEIPILAQILLHC